MIYQGEVYSIDKEMCGNVYPKSLQAFSIIYMLKLVLVGSEGNCVQYFPHFIRLITLQSLMIIGGFATWQFGYCRESSYPLFFAIHGHAENQGNKC